MNYTISNIALKTIALEADSVRGLSAFIDGDFEKTILAIEQCTGRLVISGVGKSAIVGQKIVATLNSTGTPAVFMHAADAIHGDLGMVQPDDMVLLISKSGESPEVKVLVPFIKNFGNPIIGMVGNLDSYLAKNATYILNTTVSQEACPNNLAPTSSTTAQMVMGDVLAVCLMELNGFKSADFAKYHPGGNLGKRLYLRVEDLYADNEKPAVNINAGIKEIIIEISTKRLGITAVVDADNKVVGVITDGDLRRMLEKDLNLNHLIAADILNAHPKIVAPELLAVEALEILRENDISQLVVVQDGLFAGILHIHDLIKEGIV